MYLFGRVKENIVRDVRVDAFQAILRQEYAFFGEFSSSELSSRLTNDCGSMAGNLTWVSICLNFQEKWIHIQCIFHTQSSFDLV